MMVAVAIFVIFTGVTLANYPRFSNRISLDLLSHNIALTIRQAQVFALGVRGFGGLFPPYGVYFDMTDPRSFALYADICPTTPNGVYGPALCTPGGEDQERVDTFKFPQGTNEIKSLCVNESTIDLANPTLPAGCGATSLDISFKSPRPDARLHFNGDALSTASDVEIIVANSRGDSRAIVVRRTGQISIK